MSRMRSIGALALALALFPAVAFGQSSYPNRPVKMIVPFAPGGASDFVARIITPKLGELLGQQIVVDNRAGASGNIGLEAAGKSAPDGYTIFLGNIGTIAINPGVFKDMPVDTQRDFIPVTLVAEVPSVLVVNPEVAASNLSELVALARAKPGVLNFASPGPASFDRLEMERFKKLANLNMVHIPYKGGAGPAITGLLGGETQLMFVTLSSAMTFVQAGRLRALALSTASRIEALPNVPTLGEAGYAELVASSWQGVFVPAGTPRPIVDKLHAALLAAFNSPDIRQRLAMGGAIVVTSKTPEEFAAFVGAEIVRWGKVARESGAVVD
jgi:tripartite-type tricarboxylate transporter receptor subunit TctC